MPDAGAASDSCSDGLNNGSEPDIDCGGFCAPCGTGRGCAGDPDCVTGNCVQGACRPPGAACSDIDCLGGRAADLVCGLYRTARHRNTETQFEAGAERCDPGSLSNEAYAEGLGMANYGRWLAGLPAVTLNDELNQSAQACAAIMANQGALSHEPGRDWACYTADGARGAAQSNIGMSRGAETIAESVLGFFWDGGTSNRRSVGHRRWLQSPTLGEVGFGYHIAAGSGVRADCYNVVGGGQVAVSGPAFIAYPSPGPFPLEMVTHNFWDIAWSVAIDSGRTMPWPGTDAWSVSVASLESDPPTDLALRDISSSQAGAGYTSAVTFTPDFEVVPGNYRIVVEAPGRRFAWDTELVSCDPAR